MGVPTLVAEFECVGINAGKLKVTLIIGCSSYEGFYKITVASLSVCLSVHPSVSLAFFSGKADKFFLFLIFGTMIDHSNI